MPACCVPACVAIMHMCVYKCVCVSVLAFVREYVRVHECVLPYVLGWVHARKVRLLIRAIVLKKASQVPCVEQRARAAVELAAHNR